jgi:hypothetical protein
MNDFKRRPQELLLATTDLSLFVPSVGLSSSAAIPEYQKIYNGALSSMI